MKSFEYTLTAPVGSHARPAGMLSTAGRTYTSTICVVKGGKSVNVLKLMGLMGLGVKCGETVTVTVEGEDEDVAVVGMQEFFAANL